MHSVCEEYLWRQPQAWGGAAKETLRWKSKVELSRVCMLLCEYCSVVVHQESAQQLVLLFFCENGFALVLLILLCAIGRRHPRRWRRVGRGHQSERQLWYDWCGKERCGKEIRRHWLWDRHQFQRWRGRGAWLQVWQGYELWQV